MTEKKPTAKERDLYEALLACLPFIDDALDAQEFAQEVMPEIAASEECRNAVKQARTALAKAKEKE